MDKMYVSPLYKIKAGRYLQFCTHFIVLGAGHGRVFVGSFFGAFTRLLVNMGFAMWRSTGSVLIVYAIHDLIAGNCRKVVEVASINTRSCQQETDESPANYGERFLAFCSGL